MFSGPMFWWDQGLLGHSFKTSFCSKVMSETVSFEMDAVGIRLSSGPTSCKNTELKYSLNMSAACFREVETRRGELALPVAINTCCEIRLDLVVVSKKDQNRFGLDGRD